MKNLLKKTIFLLIALCMLMGSVPSIADETEEAVIPTFEVGRSMSGTLLPDPATEIKAHAGKGGQVKFTLSLTEDCSFSITVNGGGVALSRQSEDLPVYTFISRFAWDESKILSMTAQRETGYTVTAEFLPKEPAPEQEPAEVSAPASEPVQNTEPDTIASPESEPEQEPEQEAVAKAEQEPESEAVAKPEQEAVTEEPAAETAMGPQETKTEATETDAAQVMEAAKTEENLPQESAGETDNTPEGQVEEPAAGTATKPQETETEATMTDMAENLEADQTEENLPQVLAGETESTHEEKQEEGQPTESAAGSAPASGTEQTIATEPENLPARPEENPEESQATENEDDDLIVETIEEPAGETAEEETASAQETDENEPAEEGNTEGSSDSQEIIIVKSLTPDESWSGTVRRKPSLLKLTVAQPQTIHMLVEGKDVFYSVQKADRFTEDSAETLTYEETKKGVKSWTAEAGSYLFSIRAGDNSLLAKVAVTFMNDAEFEAWETEQVKDIAEGENTSEQPEENEQEAEAEEETDSEPQLLPERSVSMVIDWDTDDPVLGDTAHMKAVLEGYDGLTYSLQWQNSIDCETWNDIAGETAESFDVMITEENNDLYWRVLVYLEAPGDEQK